MGRHTILGYEEININKLKRILIMAIIIKNIEVKTTIEKREISDTVTPDALYEGIKSQILEKLSKSHETDILERKRKR